MMRKRLTMKERHNVTEALRRRYARAGKKEKGEIVDLLVSAAGYTRAYAALVLRACRGRRVGLRTGAVSGGRRPGAGRPRIYDRAVEKALEKIWKTFDWMCGKRLAPSLPELVGVLERCGELTLAPAVKKKLLGMSAATVDRLLRQERKRWQIKGRRGTKPGSLLKNQIPVRTFAEWNEDRPGFVELDLVEHSGGSARGDYAQTLDVTDVCTGWTETQAVQNKAQVWVFAAIQETRQRFPFPLLGIDSDNGSEFINAQLLRYCRQEGITFTRSRPNRKNDNCYVEQKNYSVVRRAVGYWRYDTHEEVRVLNELYGALRLFGNFFLPNMKLVQKQRVGSKVVKKYDRPKTPYHRVIDSAHIAASVKQKLRRQYLDLNPVQLKHQIVAKQAELRALAERKQMCKKPVRNARATG